MTKRSLEILRKARNAKGWTQAQTASKARTTQGYYSRIERGLVSSPGVGVAHNLAKALGLQPGTLR